MGLGAVEPLRCDVGLPVWTAWFFLQDPAERNAALAVLLCDLSNAKLYIWTMRLYIWTMTPVGRFAQSQ